jgi:sporulation protein YlmC with PRC-barrel domain
VNVVRLSSLMGAEVVDADGRRVGRVEDLRVRRAGTAHEVEALLVGARGLLNRLGVRADSAAIPWDAVTGLEPGRVTVAYAPGPDLK